MTDDAKVRISGLSPEKRALLALKLRERSAEKETDAETARANRYEPFRLTDLQHAYWLGRTSAFALGNLASRAYVEVVCADLDPGRFAEAWRQLQQRHDMLRLVVQDDGTQRVLPEAPRWELPERRLRGASETEIAEELSAIQRSILDDATPASEWPQTRVETSIDVHGTRRLHFCFDLLNVDAGSIGILMRELAAIYSGDPLPEPPALGFRAYAEAQDRHRGSSGYERARAYWADRVPTFPGAPELPLARDPASIDRPRFVRCQRRVSGKVWTQLKDRLKASNLTTNSLLLTLYAEVLRSWSRSSHFAINLPLFNRAPLVPNVEQIVGPFTTVELLEVDFTERASFLDRMRQVQNRLLEDLEHRDYDGVELMRELSRNKGAGEALMPVVFTSLVEGRFNEAFSPFGSLSSAVNQTSQVWMDLHVDEEDGDLVVKWDSVESLFPTGMVEDMTNAYSRCLCTLASEDEAWSSLSREMLIPPDQKDRRDRVNDTSTERPKVKLTELFEQTADARRELPALISTDRTTSYGQLLDTSRRMARLLRAKGARPDSLVAIVMEKGPEEIESVMGILQSGAAYLPIDPGIPKERLHFLLDHGQVDLVLTQERLDDTLEWPSHVERIVVEKKPWASLEATALEPVGGPEDLAYVLYTSGSTGTPKGAMLEHRNVVNRMLDVIDRFEIGSSDRAIAITALQHDLSVFDMFALLLAGGALVVPEAARSRDPAHWLELIENHAVSLWNSVPAFMELFVDYLEESAQGARPELATLRSVMLSGDFIPVGLPDRIRSLSPTTRVVSLGGPTETTVWDICYPIDRVDPEWSSIPYGRPMENSRYYVLDEHFEERPDHAVGELYIAGAGVGRGYWRDEERTRERYFEHPVTGERLYRSGDLGSWGSDGNIQIVGRADFQIKLRGLRIEPGEIEACLARHPRVRSALVAVRGETQRDKRLVAWVEVPPEASERESRNGDGVDVLELERELLSPVGDVVDDATERLQFKVAGHGLRADLENRSSVPLEMREDSEDERARYLGRQSFRSFRSDTLALEDLSAVLGSLRSYRDDELPFPKYLYPSGGGLYPVQTYLYVKPDRIEGVAAGTYYHDPSANRLVHLDPEARLPAEIVTANNRAPFEEAAFLLCLVGDLRAVEPLYGGLARDFCLLEAGYMAQLLMMEGARSRIGFCPLGGLAFSAVREHLDLSTEHVFVHSLLGGGIGVEQSQRFSLIEDSGIGSPTGDGSEEEALRTELEAQLLETLPRHMVPETILVLERFPLNASGKLDRRALPTPEEPGLQRTEYIAPSSDLEKTIADAFGEVLGLEEVGARDNFFDLGGNSILILKLHLRLKTLLEREFPLVELFAHPTVAALAETLGGGDSGSERLDESRSRAEARRRARRGRSRRR